MFLLKFFLHDVVYNMKKHFSPHIKIERVSIWRIFAYEEVVRDAAGRRVGRVCHLRPGFFGPDRVHLTPQGFYYLRRIIDAVVASVPYATPVGDLNFRGGASPSDRRLCK